MAPIWLPPLVDGDLRLRRPSTTDVTAITRACQDPEIQRWTRVPAPYTEADAHDFVAMHERDLAGGTGVHLLAVEDTSDSLLGAVGLSIDRRDDSAEVGYWVVPDARGRGVATRATRLVLRFGLAHLDVAYVMLHSAVVNPASNAVARSLGFTLEGTSRDAMRIGPTGDRSAPRADANLWGLRPGELT